MQMNRRSFITTGSAAAALLATGVARAAYLNLPIGVQLFSVRTLLPTDYAGTLKQLGAIGYKEVEAAGFYNKPVEEVKAAMQAAGVRCVSAHYNLALLRQHLDEIIPFHKSLGVGYVTCSSAMHKDPSVKGPLSLDDWRWTADQFNEIATKWEELEKHTDPAKVNFEMDCGWVTVAGQDPIKYLKQYPKRIVMLHVKDFKDNKPPSVELGTGSIDYTPIFAAAAAAGHIRHCFVEQEEFQGPIMEALAVDAKYMKAHRA
jgi:sugar phosphate isomerase/epimerase